MSINYVKIFNELINEFFTELIEIFPEENKIKVQYNLFQTLSKVNVRKPCTDFMIRVIPYLEKIAMKDEEFFKGSEKPTFLNAMNFENIWTDDLSVNTKRCIWNYIKSFLTIGLKVVEMPEESLQIIQYITTINY